MIQTLYISRLVLPLVAMIIALNSMTFAQEELKTEENNRNLRGLKQSAVLDIDFTDPDQLDDLFPELVEEGWITRPAKRFGNNPLDIYNLNDLRGSDETVDLRGLTFATVERPTDIAYRAEPNEAFSTPEEYTTWYNSQSAEFKNRFSFVPPTSSDLKSFLVSSPGLPFGEFRFTQLGGVTFREVGRFNSRLSEGRRLDFIQNAKTFYRKGDTVTKIQVEGDTYLLYTKRGDFDFTLRFFFGLEENVVLEKDVKVDCFGSFLIPPNTSGEDPIICKNSQYIDSSNNVWLLAKRAN